MTDMEIPVWFFLATLFVVMLWASYLCGKKLHNLKEELEERLKAATDDAKEAKLQDQTRLIKQLFALLDITEQKDDGRDFHPNIIRSSRALDAEKLEEILGKLRGYINE